MKSYLKNKQVKEQALYRIEKGKGRFIYEGHEMTDFEMDKKFPTDLIDIKPNPDRTKNWMKDQKSY